MLKGEAMFNPDQFTMGYYDWNNQINSLEYKSLDPTYDKKKKTGMFGRAKTNIASMKPTYKGITTQSRIGASPKLMIQNREITLEDVKAVAMDHLVADHENDGTLPSKSFRDLSKMEQFNEFLMTLLQYFNCFFEHLEYEEKPHKSSYLHPSKAEIQALAEAKQKLEVTRKRLGQTYCVLILGLGLEKQHHMGCGKKRVSSTHRDKKMYKDFYAFCTYTVWITFHRKKLERVKVEVGNMLRSKVFNPALQNKAANAELETAKKSESMVIKKPPMKKKGNKQSVAERVQELLSAELPQIQKLTAAEHRRKTGKRPAIMKSIHQRSTALVSLLPMPKEESSYLFSQLNKKELQNMESDEGEKNEFTKMVLSRLPQKIGIIGVCKDLYTDSLMLKVNENEDGEGEFNEDSENENLSRATNQGNRPDAISRATTIADV